MEADFVVAAGYDIHQRRILGDVGDGFLAALLCSARTASDQNIEVSYSFPSTAQRSSRSNLVDAGKFLYVGRDLFALDLGRVDKEASADAAIIFDCLEQLGFVLLAHARQFANFSLPGKFLDAVHVADLVGTPD